MGHLPCQLRRPCGCPGHRKESGHLAIERDTAIKFSKPWSLNKSGTLDKAGSFNLVKAIK